MKRGDVVAFVFFALQAAFAFVSAQHQGYELPGLGDHYFNVPVTPMGEALSSTRTLGYPLVHAGMARAGYGLGAYPEAQMLLLIGCTAIFAFGLRRYGLTGLTAVAAASPLLWTVPVTLIMPETPAKCFAIAALGFLLWAAGTRSLVALAGMAGALFLAYQMRPAFLFLLVLLPVAWLFLYSRRWGFLDQRRWIRQGFYTLAASTVPLMIFCLLRLVAVGHFGLVSFGGQNTIGISIEMLQPETVQRLPMEDRPLAMLMTRAREGWPTERFLSEAGCGENWRDTATQYAANVNRIGRATQAQFPPAHGVSDNVEVDKSLGRMSTQTFLTHSALYAVWLTGAALETARLSMDLIFGGHGALAFGLHPSTSFALAFLLLTLFLLGWPLERRAFGEGSRTYSGRAFATVALLALLFFLLKMLLVILVEPPLPRYVQAALFLIPTCVALFCWERTIILAAALFGRPYWYNQCLVAYPAVPDAPRTLPWKRVANCMPGRRGAVVILAIGVSTLAMGWWTTGDNRFFQTLETNPDSLRESLLTASRTFRWRDSHGATVLHYAARQNDLVLVNHLLTDDTLRTTLTRDGASPLHWAAMAGTDGPTTRALIDSGLDPSLPGPVGLSPVHLAALFGNDSVLAALLAAGATPNLESPGKVTPLHLARSVSTAALLLDHGALIDAPDGSHATPFLWAPNQTLATFFLTRGADINVKADWRSFIRQGTALHKAVYQEDEGRTRWLLEQGADVNAGDINNFSPLFYALWRNNESLVSLLLDKGANIHHAGRWLTFNREDPTFRYTDIYGKTIGRHPARDTFATQVPDGTTIHPLDWAAFLGNPVLIHMLLGRDADGGRLNDVGMTPADWARLAHRDNVARLLDDLRPSPAEPPVPMAVDTVEVSTPIEAQPSAATGETGRAALTEAAQRVVDEYNAGAPNVLEGRDGFLFTRQACQYLLQSDLCFDRPGDEGSGPSPAITAIVDVDTQLKARGIHLIVVPAPMAIEAHADAFLSDWDISATAFPPRGEFVEALRAAGVDAIDLLPDFLAWRQAHPDGTLYLKEDGHWNSMAIGLAATIVSEKIRQLGALDFDSVGYREEVIEYRPQSSHIADRLPEDRRAPYLNPVWPVTRVITEDGTPYTDDEHSPILVAGDSYTLIFNDIAGQLSARLAAALGRPVASLPGRAAGPIIPRILARKGEAYIDSRKVLLWVFSSGYIRPVGKDQWDLVDLPGGDTP